MSPGRPLTSTEHPSKSAKRLPTSAERPLTSAERTAMLVSPPYITSGPAQTARSHFATTSTTYYHYERSSPFLTSLCPCLSACLWISKTSCYSWITIASRFFRCVLASLEEALEEARWLVG